MKPEKLAQWTALSETNPQRNRVALVEVCPQQHRVHQSRRSYQHAMDEFIDWYCSNRGLRSTVVVPDTDAIRNSATRTSNHQRSPRCCDAACLRSCRHTGLLSAEIVAGIRRLKSVPQLGRRVGNWLTAAEGERLLSDWRAVYQVRRRVNCSCRGAWAEVCLLISPVPPSGRLSPG
jgi:hypothetical protein